jgi:hypothetical protein
MNSEIKLSQAFLSIKKSIDENIKQLSADEQVLLVEMLKKKLILFQRNYGDIESFFDAYKVNKSFVFNTEIYEGFIKYIDNQNVYLDDVPSFQGDVEILLTNLLLKFMKEEYEFIEDSVIRHRQIAGKGKK